MKDSYLKVGDLLKLIKDNNISEDASVCYRRIEDSYFKPSIWNGIGGPKELDGWKTIKIKGDEYYNAESYNKNIDLGKLVIEGSLEQDEVGKYFWHDDYKKDRKPINLEDESILDEYIEAFCAFYNEELNLLCITAHY